MAATSASAALEDFIPDQGDRTAAASPNNDNESNAYKCLLVFAGFMAIFQVNGINSSYGVFQQYYLSDKSFLPSNTSAAAVAFVRTLGLHQAKLADLS